MSATDDVLREVAAERAYQDEKWGGPEVDDAKNNEYSWIAYIAAYSTKWFPGGFPPFTKVVRVSFRQGMIKVAALAVAAVEWNDRREAQIEEEITDAGE